MSCLEVTNHGGVRTANNELRADTDYRMALDFRTYGRKSARIFSKINIFTSGQNERQGY